MPISISFSSSSVNFAKALVWTESVEDEEDADDVEVLDEEDEDDMLDEADEDLEDTEEEDNLRHLPLYGKAGCVLFLAV